MRLILAFVIGLLSAFYFGELLTRAFKRPIHSFIGIGIILIGIFFITLGSSFLVSPINILLGTFLIGSGLGLLLHHLLSQKFVFSERLEHNFVRKHENGVERFFEILPGALTWLAITSPLWLSFQFPFAVAYLIILADTYWLFNSFKYAITVFVGYKRMENAKKTNWLDRLKKDYPETWGNYYHLVLVPTYKEALYILEPTFNAIVNSNFPKEKILILVGYEERDSPEKIEQTNKYLETIKDKVGGVFMTVHPYGLEGEVPGQGSNKNWMIKKTLPDLKKMGIEPDQIFVTTLDADFIVHKEFLGGALHKYLSTPADLRDVCSYTGVFMFHNNYWEVPTPMRLIATGTAFWQLSEMVSSDKYINYSSMSINLKSLLDIGLWIPDKVNDDSGFYWKAYFHFDGKYKVLPHFLPISADAVLDVSLFKTFQNQYLQLKRWAYGVEHIPFIVRQYWKGDNIDFWDKTDKLTFILWSYFKWGTLALFITFGGLLIPLINPSYSQSVVSTNLSTISSWILTLAFVGLFSTIVINEKTSPKRPKDWGIIARSWSYLQWAFVPIILVTIATIPAIDAQTTLMLGRHIEFRVTNKERSK